MLTMNYSKELFDILKQEEEVLKKLAQSSVIRQTEFLAFDITMQQQELTYLQAQIQYNADYLTLNYLAGVNDTTITQLEEPRLADSLPHDFYSSVFYQRYKTDSLRIENERRLIDYSYRPAVDAFADAGYNSSLQTTPYKNLGYSFGINLKVPIYDAHQKKLKYQKLDIEERNRQINKELAYTKTLITAYEKLLQTGDVKVTEFVTAITNYVNAQNTYRQNFVSRLKIMSQLNYWNQ
jgi:hypothetical protein